MFTGIITHIGTVESLKFNEKKDLLLKISADQSKIERKLEIGCSIACNGVCLTLIEKKTAAKKIIFSFEASVETCNKTTLGNWIKGQFVNLEFAMRMGDEFGGHMVLGHVDSTAKIKEIQSIKNSHKFTFDAPKNLMKFIVEKGSVTLNGVSLTVNEANSSSFSVNLIPHTIANTTFNQNKVGDLVNLEIDTIARYIKSKL